MQFGICRGSLVRPLFVLFTLAWVGCGGSGSGGSSTRVDLQSVRARSDMYSGYLASHKSQPPKDEAAFRQFLTSEQARLEKAGLTVDEMFVSPRSSEPMTWVYAKRPPNAGGITVYAYESNPVDGQRLLMGDRGVYILMDELEFKRALPDAR